MRRACWAGARPCRLCHELWGGKARSSAPASYRRRQKLAQATYDLECERRHAHELDYSGL
jgi:hypothetical protein